MRSWIIQVRVKNDWKDSILWKRILLSSVTWCTHPVPSRQRASHYQGIADPFVCGVEANVAWYCRANPSQRSTTIGGWMTEGTERGVWGGRSAIRSARYPRCAPSRISFRRSLHSHVKYPCLPPQRRKRLRALRPNIIRVIYELEHSSEGR